MVLFILGIVSLIVFMDFQRSQKRFALQNAAQQLSLDIRQAQALALQIKEESIGVPARYGIYIENSSLNSYVLFGDRKGVGVEGAYDGSVETFEVIDLPARVSFTPIPARPFNADGTACTANPALISHITFEPPHPIVVIKKFPPPALAECFKLCIQLRSPGVDDWVVGVTETGLVNVYRKDPVTGDAAIEVCRTDDI